ncbi:MAG: PAS domain S-box protein [Gemmatimonadota bacterium]|nr:PAS domain S-box protein [Gemmatimonadota bacterium]
MSEHPSTGEQRATQVARVVAVLTVLAGLVVLTGWAFDIRALTSVRPGWPTMKANSAIGSLLVGLGLMAYAGPSDAPPARVAAWRAIACACGAGAAFIGIITLLEYLLGWNAGIDTVLFAEAARGAASTHPGRMAPETALGYSALGLALVLAASRWKNETAGLAAASLAVAAVAIGVATLTAVGTLQLGREGWLGATVGSLPTALLIPSVGLSIIALVWTRVPAIWTLGSRASASFGVGLLLLVIGGLFVSRTQGLLQSRAAEIGEHEGVRLEVHRIAALAIRTQSIVNASLALEASALRAQLDTARAGSDSAHAALHALVDAAGMQAHAHHLAVVDTIMAEQRALQDRTLDAERTDRDILAHRERVRVGLADMMRRHRLLQDLEQDHAVVIDSLRLDVLEAERNAYAVISATTAGSVIVFIIALLGLNRLERRRRDATARLRESEFRWKFAIEGAGDGLWDWDVRAGTVFFSRRWKQMLGYTEHEVGATLHDWTSRVHPDDLDGAQEALRLHLADATPTYFSEHRVRHRDGSWLWVLDRGVVVQRDPDGQSLRVIGTQSDVTARRRIEQDLLESEARYRGLVESSPDAIFIHRGGNIIFVNQAAVQMMAADSPADLIGTPLLERVHPESRALALERIRRGLADGTPAPLLEERLIRLDGTTLYADVTGIVITFDGTPAVLASAHDITNRKAAVEGLALSEARFRTMFDEAPLGMAVIDSLSGELLDVNRRYETILGRSREALVGLDWMRLTHPDDVQSDLDQMDRLNADAVPGFQLAKRLVHASGAAIWVNLTVARLTPGPDGRRRHMAMIEDITALKREEETRARLETQLQASQRMESVGRLAGGVAHDFNNMLGVILGTTELSLRQVDPASPLHADLREIQGAARRSADLTRQLLSFARRQVVAPTVLDLNESVSGSLKMLQRLIGEDVHLAWNPAASLWPVTMDPSQLDQVLTNLVLNARHAIADVGTITIATENRPIDAAFCEHHPDAVPGDFVCLRVRDTGSGIDPDVLAHIFEPFYTTKALGEGTGLGLATVYGAVRQNQGFITVDSAPGRGATFDVYLPRHLAGPTRGRASGAMEVIAEGRETVLVVEDEPAILRMTTRMLESQGYAVLGTSSPQDAVRMVSERACDIDLLLTDVVMPLMNGRDLAATLVTICPRLRVLFMSGHTADVMAKRGIVEGGVSFLQKPFTTADLARRVREVLDAADPPGPPV